MFLFESSKCQHVQNYEEVQKITMYYQNNEFWNECLDKLNKFVYKYVS